LVEENVEDHQSVGSHWQTLSHNVVSSSPRHGRDRMVVGFTPTYAISVVSSNLDQGEVYTIMWKSLSVTCDSPGPLVSSSNKVDHHDITEILLKVALNMIKQTNKTNLFGDLLNIVHTKSCFQIIHGNIYI
jgi:hypothetical protein